MSWDPALEDISSFKFNEVSNNLKREISNIYANFPGRQIVTVLNYHKSAKSSSAETLVKVDLSTTNNVDLEKLKFVFERNLSQNQIGSYTVQRASENWWRIIPKPGKINIFVNTQIVFSNFKIRVCAVLQIY